MSSRQSRYAVTWLLYRLQLNKPIPAGRVWHPDGGSRPCFWFPVT